MGTKSIIGKEAVDIIIPTMNNLNQLIDCINSMYKTRQQYPMRFIIVNNGNDPLENYFPHVKDFVFVDPDHNLGWTGGIIEGLKHSTSKYVMFANDDILVPLCSFRWLSQMVRHLELKPNIASVGPASNCVMGGQNIFVSKAAMCHVAPYLIGFCILHRRSTLEEIGGPDPAFNTGDDLDISLRYTKAGYFQIVDSSIFIYHHGFQTGERVYGKPNMEGGWNSQKMTDDTNIALIRKHGFLEWWYMRVGYPPDYPMKSFDDKRQEDEIVRKHVNGCDPSLIVDLGCGGSKIIKDSIGVDILPKGVDVPNTAYSCDADIQADVEKKLPFESRRFKYVIARHILEHCTDAVGALQEWKRIMADDGRMIICLPDERISDTIILNPEHVHAFTPHSLGNLVNALGLKVESVDDFYLSDSFTMVLSKEVVL